MGKEFELKYAATPEILAKVRESFGEFTEISMETTYYDTPTGDLSAQKMTLRRRLENGVSVCTLKMPDGLHSRKEYETEAATIEEAISVLCKLSGWPELKNITTQGLIAVCGARFTRQAATVTLPECVVEIALDSGILIGGSREVPLCELEVELKSGSEAAATYFANVLAAQHGLVRESKSKFARALALAE
jgi:inorganic triphosphatase YgiF